jgi:hypothetical protein
MSTKREIKPSFKHGSISQDKRRQDVLKRQKEARRDHLRSARSMLSGGPEHSEETSSEISAVDTRSYQLNTAQVNEDNGSAAPCQQQQPSSFFQIDQAFKPTKSKRGDRVRERRRFWASQVSTPEWMVRHVYILLSIETSRCLCSTYATHFYFFDMHSHPNPNPPTSNNMLNYI